MGTDLLSSDAGFGQSGRAALSARLSTLARQGCCELCVQSESATTRFDDDTSSTSDSSPSR